MGLRQIISLFSLLMFLCAFSFAQTQPTDSDADKAKKKKEQDERGVLQGSLKEDKNPTEKSPAQPRTIVLN